MGFDYAFEIITTNGGGVDRLLGAIPLDLTDDSRVAVLRERLQHDGPGLTFCFPADGALLRYAEAPAAAAMSTIRVGSIYTSLEIGGRFAALRATAATNGMSLLFEESPAVRETFREIGRTARALSVLFDREAEQCVQVWPDEAPFTVPVPDGDDDSAAAIDARCEAILAAAAAARRDRPPAWPSWEQRWLDRDRAYYTSLGGERAEVPCRRQPCHRGSVTLSAFCRVHHFEQALGRPCPFDD